MILVTGATGNIGSEAVRLLLAAGQRVRIFTRTAAKAAALGKVDVAVGDFTDPASIATAMAGVHRALLLVPDAELLPRVAGHVFAAAKAAGVQRVVFVSSSTIAIKPQVTIGRWHLEAEEQLKATGLSWTMLRPGNFASNSLRWAGSIRSQGAVFAPSAHGKSAPIDPRDISAVAARVLLDEGHEGKTYVLTGPEGLSATEQVEKIAAALGRALRFQEVPQAQAREGLRKAGMPDPMADAVLELILAGRENSTAFITSSVRDVTGREARSYDSWVRDHLDAFRSPAN